MADQSLHQGAAAPEVGQAPPLPRGHRVPHFDGKVLTPREQEVSVQCEARHRLRVARVDPKRLVGLRPNPNASVVAGANDDVLVAVVKQAQYLSLHAGLELGEHVRDDALRRLLLHVPHADVPVEGAREHELLVLTLKARCDQTRHRVGVLSQVGGAPRVQVPKPQRPIVVTAHDLGLAPQAGDGANLAPVLLKNPGAAHVIRIPHPNGVIQGGGEDAVLLLPCRPGAELAPLLGDDGDHGPNVAAADELVIRLPVHRP